MRLARSGGRWRWAALFGTLLTAAALLVSAQSERKLGPAAAEELGAIESSRFGQVRFQTRDGHSLDAHVYRGTGFDERDGPIWFVMPGAGRAAQRYINVAAPAAERHDALAIALHFPADRYPGSAGYTLGVTRGRPNARALGENRWLDPGDYLFVELERAFDAVRRTLGGEQRGYHLFGHSAGAQFVHRLLTFMPDARVLGAVAANAGWYTLPVRDGADNFLMPYGLGATPVDEAQLRALLAAPLTVLVGERDTATAGEDELLRTTKQAMAQGVDRRSRGAYYFATGRDQADNLHTPFGWHFGLVPRAGHSAAQMMGSAAALLSEPGLTPCMSSPASIGGGIRFTEILADPPRDDLTGDANGDGARDPSDDEFVELVNTGSTPVCLTGWTLGDASEPERHVFPLGRALAPGAVLVVFGGGAPTGAFGGAQVQWAAFDGRLNLSNAGDVLTLRDASGTAAAQTSWGDCAEADCAVDHIDHDLGIGASVTRWPVANSPWQTHPSAAGTAYSPGVKADGTRW